jgi:iron(III) transport system ATP-binding protein
VAGLKIANVSKLFGKFRALDDVSIEVKDGEFLAVLGPSGCGKTTMLRLIAGFDKVDAGSIAIGERLVSSTERQVPPEDRRVGIVFQSHALWPHMTVAENVGYALTVARVNKAEIRKRVEESLSVVGLTGYGERRPSALSGGQRQRVALARCLVQAPTLVLLDEPLANLDVHLRASMEDEFVDFHRRTKSTMIYITHDQAEAMAMADRIAVMNQGQLQQVASPSELYREPATEMVAQFIGGRTLVPAQVRSVNGDGHCMVRVFGADLAARCRPGQPLADAKLSLSPRELALAVAGQPGIPGRVRRVVYQGGYFRVEASPEAAPELRITVFSPEAVRPQEGEAVSIAVQGGWVIPRATS